MPFSFVLYALYDTAVVFGTLFSDSLDVLIRCELREVNMEKLLTESFFAKGMI